MSEEKAGHKPQPKRTLEEVLRSLQDLVRNDLVSERTQRPPARDDVRSPHDDPDSFNEALARLDEVIDEKVIRPAAHAPRAFPEPPPDGDPGIDDPDIEWADAGEAPGSGRDEGARHQGGATDTGGAARDAEAAGPIGEAAPEEDPIFDFEGPTLETVELEAPTPEKTPAAVSSLDLQDAFHFADRSPNADAPAAGTERAAAPNEKVEAAPGREERIAGTDPAIPERGDDRMTVPPESADTPPEAPENRRPAGPAEDRTAAAEPPTLNEEIPVLNEVAGIEPAPTESGPDPGRARDIAVRAVARLNIERRKAGEPPLDIKTIERLQRYLAEALANPRAGMPE